jgi:hypothetical protein
MRLVLVHDASCTKTTAPGEAPSPGDAAGARSGECSGRPVDLDALRRFAPECWSRFLRDHFRCATEVAFVFDVDEKTARNWWHGSTGANMRALLHAQAIFGPEYVFSRLVAAA